MKRTITLLAALALVAGVFAGIPARAEEPTPIPEVVNIEDPLNDANFLNDQDQAPNGDGDHVTPADAGSVSDILKVWFTHTATTVSAHVLTERPGPASSTLLYRVYASPGEGTEGANSKGCIRFLAIIGGVTQGQDTSTYRGDNFGAIDDVCNNAEETPGEFKIEPAGDNGILTITGPRSASKLLGDGMTLSKPYAVVKLVAGADGIYQSSLTSDNTKIGTDYVLGPVGGGPKVKTPPGKNDPPGVKNGAGKGKGKKRGHEGKGKKAPKNCKPYAPGEMGAKQPSVVVTDAHTAEKPLAHPITLDADFDEGLQGDPPTATVNVQVDSKLKEAGLYVTFEFPERRDYDLWAYFADGSEAASSHGFQPLIDTKGAPGNADQSNTASNHGGESTANSENLVGIVTPDCGGYTVQAKNYFGEGGDFELKFWLGEGKTPAGVPAEGARVTSHFLATV